MKTKFFLHPGRTGAAGAPRGRRGVSALLGVLLAAGASLQAMPVLDTLSGGPTYINPLAYGYVDGNTANDAQFYTPWGLALNGAGTILYVADRDNDAIRQLYLGANITTTFTTDQISKPVGVALDEDGNVYVLNRGNGDDGTLLQFDSFGALVTAKASGLTNAGGLALDANGNVFVTVQSNTIIRVTPANVVTTVATVTNAGTSLQGVVVTDNGLLAACDSGRHVILQINPFSGTNSILSGAANVAGDVFGTKNNARYRAPHGITKSGGGLLVVADHGNHRVKVVDSLGTVTNLYGVKSNFWYTGAGAYPGWWDGTVCTVDMVGCPEGRQPVGLACANDGTVYSTETYYHLIRKTTATGLPPFPPPPPQVPPPAIGWVDFPHPSFLSVLRAGTSFVFNNDVILAIKGTNGSQTFFTSGPTPSAGNIPDPSPSNGGTPPAYEDNWFQSDVVDLPVTRYPDMVIRAIGTKNDGSPDSQIVQARIQFIVANPTIIGDNAASFAVTNQTADAEMYYTLDGTDPSPTNATSVGPIEAGTTLSFNITAATTFKIRGFRLNYQPSGVVTAVFSTNSFVPNSITFGFANGEASSDFIASAGQTFYAPVTMSILPSTRIFSLQFNLTVTNLGVAPSVQAGAVGFQSMLVKPHPTLPGFYVKIPPAMFLTYLTNMPPVPPAGSVVFPYFDGWFADLRFTNSTTGNNLIGVGWLERDQEANLYNTAVQDLIKYSLPHDTLFDEAGLKIVPGGYMFQIPATAAAGEQYQIQIGRPSATSDGIGRPGSDVYIATPTNGALAGGAVNSIKHVTVGQRKYVVGDAAPFRWFNAGDFGNSNLLNDDVMQVFQSAIYNLNIPPEGSDLFDALDSCCGTYTPEPGTDYLVQNVPLAPLDPLFDGNDSDINSIAFGDSVLDVTDVYVTFRRSLDPSLQWFQRFWTNGIRAAQTFPNQFPGSPAPVPAPVPLAVTPEVQFLAGDGIVSAGQSIYVPIDAYVHGDYPLRVLALGLTIEPLDGSPALTVPVQFTPNVALGTPTRTSSKSADNYAATWLNSGISGLTGNANIGLLRVTLPANATTNSAYAIHFDHASGSPNGLASLKRSVRIGLLTGRDRSASSLGDGIPDAWRLRHFGTLNNILAQANADADGDSLNNRQEYLAGTNPNDATSVLKLKSSKGQGAAVSVRWPSVAGKQYVIERATSAFAPAWSAVSTNSGTGWDMEYQDNSGGDGPRFYRVRAQ